MTMFEGYLLPKVYNMITSYLSASDLLQLSQTDLVLHIGRDDTGDKIGLG